MFNYLVVLNNYEVDFQKTATFGGLTHGQLADRRA